MKIIQVRLPDSMVKDINRALKKSHYTTKSDLIRDAIRRLLIRKTLSIPGEESITTKKGSLPKRTIAEFDYIH
ncbi:ribbon-helix-helix protein, CopG family [Candidatus Woesearchaeota archaeon]|nr:ribbon-helix-helix protein, CopG family [Candidatus Woesearchaeota archaeon]